MNPVKWFLKQAFPEHFRTEEEREQAKIEIEKIQYRARYGIVNSKLKCKYCEEVGSVHYRRVYKKTGFSTGKAVAGLITGGTSILATGLAKKEGVAKFYCGNCEMSWEGIQ